MLPISDISLYQTHRPYVNIALIALNTIVFAYSVLLNDFDLFRFNYMFGLIPAELAAGRVLEGVRVLTPTGPVDVDIASPIGPWGTVFTSMFMHGGWMHFIGNMLFLWVFGDNLEARLGHVKYLLFYLGCGIVAVWAHVVTDVDSTVPLIGASGAISGVLGAYLVLYPYNRVTTLIFMLFITVIRSCRRSCWPTWGSGSCSSPSCPGALPGSGLPGPRLRGKLRGLHGPRRRLRRRCPGHGPVQAGGGRAPPAQGPPVPSTGDDPTVTESERERPSGGAGTEPSVTLPTAAPTGSR